MAIFNDSMFSMLRRYRNGLHSNNKVFFKFAYGSFPFTGISMRAFSFFQDSRLRRVFAARILNELFNAISKFHVKSVLMALKNDIYPPVDMIVKKIIS